MNTTLRERIGKGQEVLEKIQQQLSTHSAKLSDPFREYLQARVIDIGAMENWLLTLEARDDAFEVLRELDSNGSGELVKHEGRERRFAVLRMIYTQSYLGLNWALSDQITAFVGKILCHASLGNNPKQDAKLVATFITGDENKGEILTPILKTIRPGFGWPICISYELRNCFLHDGGTVEGRSIFFGTAVEAGFELKTDAWEKIKEKAKISEPSTGAIPTDWPGSPLDDLRLIISSCERSMDDALGVLLGTGCHLLKAHMALMLEEI